MIARHAASPARQRGAATLVVVMMLLLIMALLAAYANRSMLFEQRIATSYYRGSLAQEVSEAGLEWTVAMLNGTAVDGSCAPVAAGGQRFVDRYLKFDADDRRIRQNLPSDDDIDVSGFLADCTRTSAGWTCRCPDIGTRALPGAVDSVDLVPSFGIRISPKKVGRTDTMVIESLGCTTSVVDQCAKASDNITKYQGASKQTALLALVGAVRSPPAAPLVAQGSLTASGAGGLGLHNTSPGSAGLLVTAGGALSGLLPDRMESVPGTPAASVQISPDPLLSKVGADLFRMFMGATAERYQTHPALRMVSCAGDCAPALLAAYDAGARILWVNGPMTISSNQILGSATAPVVIIADGAVTLTGPFQLSGMLVSRGDLSWTNTSGLTSLVNGIVLAEGDVTTVGQMDIHYHTGIVDQLRNRLGSFVRVPGGWSDKDTN
jgi:hypothetical protein